MIKPGPAVSLRSPPLLGDSVPQLLELWLTLSLRGVVRRGRVISAGVQSSWLGRSIGIQGLSGLQLSSPDLVLVLLCLGWRLPPLPGQLPGQQLWPQLVLVLEDGGQTHAVHPLHHAVLGLRSKQVCPHARMLRLECKLSVDAVILGDWTDGVGRQQDRAQDLLLCGVYTGT